MLERSSYKFMGGRGKNNKILITKPPLKKKSFNFSSAYKNGSDTGGCRELRRFQQ